MPKDKAPETLPEIEIWMVSDCLPFDRNAKLHPAEQIEQIKASIRRFGYTNPILVDETGLIAAGHGRHIAVSEMWAAGEAVCLSDGRALPDGTVPVVVQRGWTEEQRRAYTIADNRLTEIGGWDMSALRVELADLSKGQDSDLAFAMGFDEAGLAAALAEASEGSASEPAEPAPKSPSISDRFGAVPFSVLNAREGWWQDRKRAWLAIGIKSELGRGENGHHAAPGGSPMVAGYDKSGKRLTGLENIGGRNAKT